MNFQDATRWLDELAPGRPAFVEHSHVVAAVATRIADALAEGRPGIDVERIRVQALLHDVGRSLTHGGYHGWVGYAMLRHRGEADAGRGCISHWLRGLPFEEAVELGRIRPRFLKRVYEELELPRMEVEDYVVSLSDFSVAHTAVVPVEEREADLVNRYGESRWLRRNAAAARDHRATVERWMGRPLADVVPELARATGATLHGRVR